MSISKEDLQGCIDQVFARATEEEDSFIDHVHYSKDLLEMAEIRPEGRPTNVDLSDCEVIDDGMNCYWVEEGTIYEWDETFESTMPKFYKDGKEVKPRYIEVSGETF